MKNLSLEEALALGRRAAEILESVPIDGRGYSDDEVAAQYAATDRLLTAFRQLDQAVANRNTPTEGEGHVSS